jgi:hypothetical protein
MQAAANSIGGMGLAAVAAMAATTTVTGCFKGNGTGEEGNKLVKYGKREEERKE